MMMEPMIPNLAVRQRSNPASACASSSRPAAAASSVLAHFVSHWQARSPLPMITPELRHLTLMGCCSNSRAYRFPPDADAAAAAGLLVLLALALVADEEEVEHARRMKLKRRHICSPGYYLDRPVRLGIVSIQSID